MKSYRQFCGVAKALDLLGERWTLLVVRDLLLGPRRFSDLQHGLPGIAPAMLSKRLEHLVQQGLVHQEEVAGGQAYILTPQGRAAEGVVLALGAYGAQFMQEPTPDEALDPRWAVVSLKRRYKGSKRAGVVAMGFDEQWFTARIGGPSLDVFHGAPERWDVQLQGGFAGWFPLFTRKARLRELLTAGGLRVSGSSGLAAAFARSIGALA